MRNLFILFPHLLKDKRFEIFNHYNSILRCDICFHKIFYKDQLHQEKQLQTVELTIYHITDLDLNHLTTYNVCLATCYPKLVKEIEDNNDYFLIAKYRKAVHKNQEEMTIYNMTTYSYSNKYKASLSMICYHTDMEDGTIGRKTKIDNVGSHGITLLFSNRTHTRIINRCIADAYRPFYNITEFDDDFHYIEYNLF